MKGYTATLPNGEAMHYVHHKRWLWLLSVVYPLEPFLGVWLHSLTGNESWLLLPIAINFGLGPVVDHWLGEDEDNPPDEVLMQLERDRYFRRLTYVAAPLHLVTLVGTAGYAASSNLDIGGLLGLAFVAGMTAGLAINTGHELGHKRTRLEKWLARIVLAIPAYGHFTIAHNRGHHRDVATPADPASARMGENIYRFACREIPGAFREAWRIEKTRLAARDKPVWHPANTLLQSWGLSTLLAAGIVVAFGGWMIPFLLVHHLAAYWQLTSANYVEHYGLLRSRDDRGRYEPCKSHHSWNSNYLFSNLVLFHLERHSDHHAHPQRRYQALRCRDDLPTLPSGYFGAYLLAWLPALWYRAMDRRLLALPRVRGDLGRVNIDPSAAPALRKRYGTAQGN